MDKVEIIGLKLPLIEEARDLADEILKAIERSNVEILDNDIIVVTDKLISKCFGSVVNAEEVKPSKRALKLAKKTHLDPRFVELVLRNCDEVVAVVPIKRLVREGHVDMRSLAEDPEAVEKLIEEYPSFFITRKEGMLWSDSGIDSSNLPPGHYSIPVQDHDLIAKVIREKICKATGKEVAVVICDTEVFLGGSMDFARGSYGIDPVDRHFACKDFYGKPKYGGVDLIAHEICSAAALVFKQAAEGIPVAIVRGVRYRKCECGFKELVPKVDILKVAREVLRESVRVLGLRWLLRAFRHSFNR
jgi:coenzyme F420-0:L-glutamate ligase/coenzyme F420-1:gamma-L-glutamate ligase